MQSFRVVTVSMEQERIPAVCYNQKRVAGRKTHRELLILRRAASFGDREKLENSKERIEEPFLPLGFLLHCRINTETKIGGTRACPT